MAKRGRPPVEDPRNNQYRIRLNEEENNRLDRVCKDLGMSKADTFRVLLENYEKDMK